MMATDLHDLQIKGLVEQQNRVNSHFTEVNWIKGVKKESILREPSSVLDHNCSINSPNSVSTRSSSINGSGHGSGFRMHDFEGLAVGEGSVLPWIMGQVDEQNLSFKNLLQCGSSLGFDGLSGVGGGVNPSGVENWSNLIGSSGFSGAGFDCNVVVGEQVGYGELNPNYYAGPLGYGQVELNHPFLPPVKRNDYGGVQVSRGALSNEGHEDLLMSVVAPQHIQKSLERDKELQVSVLRDQLNKVSEMFQTGNFALAQVILARLNHQASLPGNTLVGAAALYVKEELEKLLSMNGMPTIPPPSKSLSLDDVIDKISAYKLFSEVSPVMQFVDFTCTQALLEALEDADTIHVLDFDIGCGSMWASFIRELPFRKKGAPFLKITVLASVSSHHAFEVALICDNILEFATEYGVSVDIKVLNLDLFDSSSCTFPGFQIMENEVVAIKFPIWACSHSPFLLPPLLSFMKQCSPKIVITFDRGSDRCDLSLTSHIRHSLNSCFTILESLSGSSVSSEIIRKIEDFLIKPSIERIIQGRIQTLGKMQANRMNNWKSIFPSAGFVPAAFSNVTEYQANELLTKLPMKGFNVEKRQASIVLRWLSHELVAGLAWKCL